MSAIAHLFFSHRLLVKSRLRIWCEMAWHGLRLHRLATVSESDSRTTVVVDGCWDCGVYWVRSVEDRA